MGEFTSDLMNDLAASAHISYDPRKPDDEFVYERKFTNADARRMDSMKTAIVRLLLLRARNYMITNNEDSKPPKDREAKVELSIKFIDASIFHRDRREANTFLITRRMIEDFAEKIDGGSNKFTITGIGDIIMTGGSGIPKYDAGQDKLGGKTDLDILTALFNFIADVEVVRVAPRLQLNCK